MISEHASPLAPQGGVDAGGQNTYASHVARCLARRGPHVDVLTRRDAAALPAAVDLRPGVRVLHIPAGRARFVPKEQLLQHMPAFTRASRQLLAHSVPYDVVHANFFMSGLAGLRLKAGFGVPLVMMTFHALGRVRLEHPGAADAFPPERIAIEARIVRGADRVVAECPQDRSDLLRLYGADGADGARSAACARWPARRGWRMALAARLAQLHANPALAQAMGRAGMRRVRTMFTWDGVADALATVCQQVRRPREAAAVPAADLDRSQPGAVA
ncbi:glycosyltransferase [Azohydromonas lata]|uniref:glycosyltransferase n=1 Tax=Azohydromonas lata TaxID=45677 RepID=UPI00082C2AB1|nr:glycosyltransferase [Azohydromonas lata]